MSRLHLFIGHHKTGSTSLQSHLARRAGELAKIGVLYPHVDLVSILRTNGAQSCSSYTQTNGRLRKRIQLLKENKNYLEPHNALAFRMLSEATGCAMPAWHQGVPESSKAMLELVNEQMEDLKPDDLLIISEVLGNFGTCKKNLCQKLMSSLNTREANLLCILRKPDDYLVSWYGQELCFGYKQMGRLGQRIANSYVNSIHLRYDWMLEQWMRDSRFNSIIIEDYRNVNLMGGTVSWFNSTCTTQTSLRPDTSDETTRANPSLHPIFFEAVRFCNLKLGRVDSAQLVAAIKQVTPRLNLPSTKTVEVLGLEARELIYRTFLPVNRTLGRMVGRDEFFVDIESILEQKENQADRLGCQFVSLLLEQHEDLITQVQRDALAEWLEEDSKRRREPCRMS